MYRQTLQVIMRMKISVSSRNGAISSIIRMLRYWYTVCTDYEYEGQSIINSKFFIRFDVGFFYNMLRNILNFTFDMVDFHQL